MPFQEKQGGTGLKFRYVTIILISFEYTNTTKHMGKCTLILICVSNNI